MLTWTNPTFSVGFIAALVIAILAILLFALGRMPLEWTMGICAVCALRL
jgi:hypothetical protein